MNNTRNQRGDMVNSMRTGHLTLRYEKFSHRTGTKRHTHTQHTTKIRRKLAVNDIIKEMRLIINETIHDQLTNSNGNLNY